jgi:hypothetical protein
MSFAQTILAILDTQMTTPTLYGWFHVASLLLTALVTVLICRNAKNHSEKRVKNTVFWVAVVVAVLEVYKQINYTFSYEGGISADYQWYAFPWQFCSTPMYVGLLVGLFRKGKVHDALCAYLATFSVFAGVAVMLYPASIYVSTIGINIQTTICHCSMIVIGAYLFASGHVKLEHKTLFKALPVFAAAVGIAVVLNELAVVAGIVPNETFNMFFVSRHCEPSLPVYSLVQGVVPYPWCLIIYIAGFSIAAYVMLLVAMGVGKLTRKKVTV